MKVKTSVIRSESNSKIYLYYLCSKCIKLRLMRDFLHPAFFFYLGSDKFLCFNKE